MRGVATGFGVPPNIEAEKNRNASNLRMPTDRCTVIEIRSERLQQASENCRHQFNGAFLGMLVDRLALANTRLSQLLAERQVTTA